jgi:hypothetical protein
MKQPDAWEQLLQTRRGSYVLLAHARGRRRPFAIQRTYLHRPHKTIWTTELRLQYNVQHRAEQLSNNALDLYTKVSTSNLGYPN